MRRNKSLVLLAGALLATPTFAVRNRIKPCPEACSLSGNPFDWIQYHSMEHLAQCKEPMLLDLSLYNDLSKADSHHTILACTPDTEREEEGNSDNVRRRATSKINYEEDSLSLQLASWGQSTRNSEDTGSIETLLQTMQVWLGQSSQDRQFHILGQYGKTTAGLYVGPRFSRADAGKVVVQKTLQLMEDNTAPLSALQNCGSGAQDTIGIAISTNGDISSIQKILGKWRDGECPSDSDSNTEVSDITVPKAPTTVAISGLRRRAPVLRARAATCETTQVELGDSCAVLAERCGISGDDFMDYNDDDLCSTLVEGQYVCCSEGDLPDFSPDPFDNGTCYTHQVETGESCASLAAEWSLEQEDLETFNEDTWGWRGCENLQASLNICLSKGDPPFPAPIPNAICGPQVPGTENPGNSSSAEWALLNPCPLNACCNINGWCGINPEFCEYEDSGAPGTGVCVSNCGTEVVNDDIAPDQFSKVGYFLASNLNRECLTMSAYEIKGSDYTHIQFAFGNIKDDFSIGLMEGDEQQFAYFKTMRSLKRVISFGGWDFSTFPDTYHIFRNGVKEENRETFAQNVVDFVEEHDLDGVDFDWEYPGAPDIPGIPAGEEEEGDRYLEFLKVVRDKLPEGKSLSIAAPASFWYLQGFPIEEIGDLVDYIVFMTYDLRGQWDYDSNDPPLGCPDGNCLRSHINSTETQYALAMVTKALVQTRKLMVGVSSYGRSFEMSEVGCTGPTCTYTGNGAAEGRCTKTSGYLANAEINEILDDNSSASHEYDQDSDSDIMVYDDNQWVAYMTDETRNRRINEYSGMNMGGSVEWSIDLQRFTVPLIPGGVFFPIPEDMDIEEFCSTPDWDTTSMLEASEQRNVSGYLDYFFGVVRDGDTSNWVTHLFNGTDEMSCDVYPEGPCDFPDPDTCEKMEDESPSLYWAQFAVANYFHHMVQYGSMFEAEVIGTLLDIGQLVDDFPVKTPEMSELSNIFGIFSGALGIAGTAAGALPGFPGGEATAAALDGLGSMFDILGGLVEEEEPDDGEDDLEAELEAQLSMIWDAGWNSAAKALIAVFETGDMKGIPDDLKEGDYEFPLSNFFHGRWLHKMSGSEALDIKESLGENMMKSMAGSTLMFSNYYIVKNGFDNDDCTDQRSGKLIDDTCYTLEFPGTSGGAPADTERSDFSRVVEEETLKSMTDTYKMDIEEIYKLSETCQSATNDYEGKVEMDGYAVFADDDKPQCFYSLPVITASTDPDDLNRISWRTPCWVVVSNMTAEDDAKPVVGKTYLSPRLDEIFTREFCVPCYDSNTCSIG
ncbi:hypothetical protein BDV06DRAFT_220125 [Aspergillus oleicola]